MEPEHSGKHLIQAPAGELESPPVPGGGFLAGVLRQYGFPTFVTIVVMGLASIAVWKLYTTTREDARAAAALAREDRKERDALLSKRLEELATAHKRSNDILEDIRVELRGERARDREDRDRRSRRERARRERR